jgi:hypothetical protein
VAIALIFHRRFFRHKSAVIKLAKLVLGFTCSIFKVIGNVFSNGCYAFGRDTHYLLLMLQGVEPWISRLTRRSSGDY